MNIGPQIFVLAQILIPYPATVAGGAVARHGRRLVKQMSFDKATTNQIWLANVTFAARCVATAAMVTKHALNRFMIFWYGSGIQHRPIPFQIAVQTIVVSRYHIRMAFAARLYRVFTWVLDKPKVCINLVWRVLPSMTIGTGHLAMYFFGE
jgi:hypothetical protein